MRSSQGSGAEARCRWWRRRAVVLTACSLVSALMASGILVRAATRRSRALGLVESLSGGSDISPWFAASERFEELGSAGIWALRRALNGDIRVNCRAGVPHVLGAMRSEESLDLLIAALQDDDATVLMMAAEGLFYRPTPKAVRPLVELLESRRPVGGLTEIFACLAMERATGIDFGMPDEPFGPEAIHGATDYTARAELFREWEASIVAAMEKILDWWQTDGEQLYGLTDDPLEKHALCCCCLRPVLPGVLRRPASRPAGRSPRT